MRKPRENISIFKKRREKILASLEGSALLVGAAPEAVRNHDVEYPYRQDSNMYYLTGFEEPESICLLISGPNPQSILFVRRKDVERETWTGFRFGQEAAKAEFGFDQVYAIDEFEKKCVELLKGVDAVYYRLFKNEELDHKVKSMMQSLRLSRGRSGKGLLSIHDADKFLGEFRIFKSEAELENQRRACEITAQAHIAAMRFTRPGVNELQIQGVLAHHFMMNGATREGYGHIVASGAAATTLHYNFNDQPCKDGDLLLIDSGAEYNFYSGDITRTFPVSGKFTEIQKKVYGAVLAVQKDLVAMVKPGCSIAKLNETAIDRLTEVMLDLGLLSGRKADIISSLEYKKYYPHNVSHWLGMDVHDAGMYFINDEPRAFEPGMIFTIEPGLYIPADDKSAPPELRGIGIRIEDNILVTANGYENLTQSCPKEIDELEAIIGR